MIKVRYDFINSPQALNYTLTELLDNYSDIFQLNKDMSIALGFPYDSKYMYKLAYVIKNLGKSESKSKLLVVPYLHENKVFN